MIKLDKGTLWQALLRRSGRALEIGALLPIQTGYEFVEDSGVRFFVRMLSNLARKEEDKKKRQLEEPGEPRNPFLPYEEDLFVADITDTHVALLNKFNVVENHLLIVTRRYEDQEVLLTPEDFEAMWVCLAEYDGLGFYNGGAAAGASQAHKHLQVVPLPLAPGGPALPISPLLDNVRFSGRTGVVPEFPFLHAFGRISADAAGSGGSGEMFDLYRELLGKVGMRAPGTDRLMRQSGPYCLLATREWMLIVPRSREFFDGVSINSLGYAGAMLVKNEEQMTLLKEQGPMRMLKSVGLPLNNEAGQ